MIHDGSSRNCGVATRNGRAEPRGLAPPSAAVPAPLLLRRGQAPKKKGASPQQYGEGPSGEPARRQACRSHESAIAAEALVNHAG